MVYPRTLNRTVVMMIVDTVCVTLPQTPGRVDRPSGDGDDHESVGRTSGLLTG